MNADGDYSKIKNMLSKLYTTLKNNIQKGYINIEENLNLESNEEISQRIYQLCN